MHGGFESFPSSQPEQEAEQSEVVFDSAEGYQGIVNTLLELKTKNQVIAGSSQSYSPVELGRLLTEAVWAMDRVARGSTIGSVSPKDPGELNELPEVRFLTRSHGFRQAVVDAWWANQINVTTAKGTWFSGRLLESLKDLER